MDHRIIIMHNFSTYCCAHIFMAFDKNDEVGIGIFNIEYESCF